MVKVGENFRDAERGAVGPRSLVFGGDDKAVARAVFDRGADDGFSTVVLRSVDEVDAEVERTLDDAGGVLFAVTFCESEFAAAAAAEAGNTDIQTGSTEGGVFHGVTSVLQIIHYKQMLMIFYVLCWCIVHGCNPDHSGRRPEP